MKTSRPTPVAALFLVAALTLAACGAGSSGGPGTTAPDDTPIGGPYPVADLEFVIEHPDHETISYRVVCLGDTATIDGEVDLDERAACLALAGPEVQRRLIEGAGDRICTQQYGGPEVATITGTIDEAPVDATVDRTDGCGISDWDDLLSDLLPPAGGVAG